MVKRGKISREVGGSTNFLDLFRLAGYIGRQIDGESGKIVHSRVSRAIGVLDSVSLDGRVRSWIWG